MGMIGDIAILGAVVIGGYYLLTNFKNIVPGAGAVPVPAETTTPAATETGLPPFSDGVPDTSSPTRVQMRDEIKKQFGHSTTEECKAGSGISKAKGSKCKCQTYKGVTFIECVTDGRKCMMADCGKPKDREDLGVSADKCKCNFTLDWNGTPASSSATYYSYMARPYKVMVPSRSRGLKPSSSE